MLKKKNIYVIFFSVLIVFFVILSSFLGLIIYLQWRQLNLAYKYYEALEKSDTISYAKNVQVGPLKIRSGFRRAALAEGQITNKGKRTVISLTLKINFLDALDNPISSYTVYPLEPFQPPKGFKKMRFTYFAFLHGPEIEPNKSIIFRSPLRQAPKQWSGRISAEVISLRLKPI